ncbi:hypothetical protein ACFL6S_19775 [Candidatus Poribacteria bacterium]
MAGLIGMKLAHYMDVAFVLQILGARITFKIALAIALIMFRDISEARVDVQTTCGIALSADRMGIQAAK